MDSQTFNWRDFVPLAKSMASKFHSQQERGKFEYNELVSEAVEALATSKGVNYARKRAIPGALLDFARDDHKLVPDVEMTEAEFERTRGDGRAATPVAIRRVYVLGGVRHTLYTQGPYRSNARLLAGAGKATSKHDKVRVAIGRATYNDGWDQKFSEQVRAKVGPDEQQKADRRHHAPSSRSMASLLNTPEGDPPKDGVGQADYVGHGRKQRFSRACHNHGEDYQTKDWPWLSDGKMRVINPNRKPVSAIDRTAEPDGLNPDRTRKIMRGRGLTDSEIAVVRLTEYGLGPASLKHPLGYWGKADLMLAGPKAVRTAWPRETGYLRFDDDNRPECWWGLPDVHPCFAWVFVPGFAPVLAVGENGWTRQRKIFSPTCIKSPVWGEVIGVGPAILAAGPARLRSALGGSRAERSHILLPPDAERAVAGTESAADGAAPFFAFSTIAQMHALDRL